MAKQEEDIIGRIEETLLKIKVGNVYNIDLETCELLEEVKEEILKLRRQTEVEK
tara:strand:+ start:285 stop:446 length:162 start_codon:yes stop_codon:yes gene_type:complete